MTLKEALDSGYCSLEDDIDFDDTPQGEKIACLKLEIERLNNIINKLEKFVKKCNEYNSKCNSTIYEARAFEDSVILHKIKELKGSVSNE